MAKKKINIDNMQIDEEDVEYEKKLAEEAQEERRKLEEQAAAEEAMREKQEREADKERQRQIDEEKRELLKLKSGLTDEEDSALTKKDAAYEKPHGWAAVSNFWYHYKFVVTFSAIAALIVGFLVYTEVTRERDDLCVIVCTDNDLSQRSEEIEEFFEKYVDDLDGNGYVSVGVISIPLSKNLDPNMQNTYSQKFLAQVQTGTGMIVITDSHTKADFMELMKSDLAEDFPGNEYIDEKGFSLNSKVMAEEFKYELMPNDVYMSIREPAPTMSLREDDAQAKYDESFEVFKRIVEDITARCEETGDTGLETEPIKYDEDDNPLLDSSAQE